MPIVRMFYSEMMCSYHVTFMEGNRGLGQMKFNSEEPIFEMLRRAHNSVEDHQIVEYAMQQRRPGSVELRLNDQQYAALKARLARKR
jgi:hypothetical protein